MKIEMGESLFYSWIRHVKECQVVQTNWKPSPSWTLYNEAVLIDFMSAAKERLSKRGYKEYSKQVFGIDFPLLVLADAEPRAVRYYVKELDAYGNRYYLCSQWFEGNRTLLMAWLQNHAAKL